MPALTKIVRAHLYAYIYEKMSTTNQRTNEQTNETKRSETDNVEFFETKSIKHRKHKHIRQNTANITHSQRERESTHKIRIKERISWKNGNMLCALPFPFPLYCSIYHCACCSFGFVCVVRVCVVCKYIYIRIPSIYCMCCICYVCALCVSFYICI